MLSALRAVVPETTMRIGADELAKLVDITAETTRRTAEMPAVCLDELLCTERTPIGTSFEELTFENPPPDLIDLGDLLREELGSADIHDTPLSWLEPPTEQKRLRIVFAATAGAFA